MIRRYATAIVLGALATLAVLFTMQVLIATARGRLDESGTRHFVDFVRVPREEALQRKDRKPDKPVEPTAPPPETVEPRVDSIDPAVVAIQQVIRLLAKTVWQAFIFVRAMT